MSYNPAGRDGIEPPLRVLEARPVTMTLRPAARRGIEPPSLHGQWSCDASRITGQRGGGRESNPPPQGHDLPSSPSTATTSGSPWSRTTFSRASAERYHWTSSRPAPPEPSPGIEPEPPAYEAGARPSSSQGHTQLQRKESNLRRDRLTAGCLTIRLRWNGRGAGASRPPVVGVELSKSGPPCRGHTYPFACANARTQLRGQDSNLHCRCQRPASLPLDDPETSRPGGT